MSIFLIVLSILYIIIYIKVIRVLEQEIVVCQKEQKNIICTRRHQDDDINSTPFNKRMWVDGVKVIDRSGCEVIVVSIIDTEKEGRPIKGLRQNYNNTQSVFWYLPDGSYDEDPNEASTYDLFMEKTCYNSFKIT